MNLTGKVALVTGGSRGIGKAIALALADAGCDVAFSYRENADAARATVAEIEGKGRRGLAIKANLALASAGIELVKEAESVVGSPNILVNNVGINPVASIDSVTDALWDQSLTVNLTSAFRATQAALPAMRAQKWGRIIMMSSLAAQTGGVIGPHYAASKAGLLGLMHSYAMLLAKEGITANAIAPALIETDMIKNNPNIKPDLLPVGRFGLPEEVARVAVELARTGFITGQTINVNGGWYMS